MHNLIGSPGRKIEVPIGSAKMLRPKVVLELLEERRQEDKSPESSSDSGTAIATATAPAVQPSWSSYLTALGGPTTAMAIRVDGIDGNLIIDQNATYFHQYRLLQLLLIPHGLYVNPTQSSSEAPSTTLAKMPVIGQRAEKEHRANWRKETTSRRKKK